MFKLAVKENVDRKFKRLRVKDKEMLRLIGKKVEEILANAPCPEGTLER